MKKFFIVNIIVIIFLIINSFVFANEKYELNDFQKAVKEVADSYYLKGSNIQYSQHRRDFFSPEDVTSQKNRYMDCSGFVQNVFREALGITTPRVTTQLCNYAKTKLGNKEVVLYYHKESDGSREASFYDENYENNIYILQRVQLLKIY